MESKIEQFEADIDYAKLDIQDLKNEVSLLKSEVQQLKCDVKRQDKTIRSNFNLLLIAMFVIAMGIAWITVDSMNTIVTQIASVINALIELK